MLDDRGRRLREVRRDAPGGVDVQHVVEARRLSVELLHRGHRAALATDAIEGGLLVGVLAVPEVAYLPQRERQLVGEGHAGLDRELRRDRRVVCGGVRERLRRERTARLERDRPALRELVEDGAVALA